MKRLRAVFVVLAALVSIGLVTSCGTKDDAPKADQPSTTTGSTESSKAPSGDEAADSATYAVGELVELDDWQVKVHGVQDPVEVAADELFAPDEGFRRVVIDVEVTNNTGEEEYVSPALCFELKNTQDSTSHLAGGGDLGGDLASGASMRGTLAYDVPEAATGLTLNFQCDPYSGEPAVIALS